jgi:hypothetical protein
MGIERTIDSDLSILYEGSCALAPIRLRELLGMYTDLGETGNFSRIDGEDTSLVSLNDGTDLTTQEIGQLCLDLNFIEGGENTPFKPLSDYPL